MHVLYASVEAPTTSGAKKSSAMAQWGLPTRQRSVTANCKNQIEAFGRRCRGWKEGLYGVSACEVVKLCVLWAR